jgi:hypothetical protein
MRRVLLVLALSAVTGCASAPPGGTPFVMTPEQQERHRGAIESERQLVASLRQQQQAAELAMTPTDRARRALDAAKITRENELIERAVSGSPDYTAAVRRAAIANVDGEAAIPQPAGTPRRAAAGPTAREAAITAEESRLSEAVEVRRRQRLADQAATARAQQDQQAAIICRARGNIAGSQPAFGGFGIAGAINAGVQQGWAAANTEAACFNAYRATGIMPSY